MKEIQLTRGKVALVDDADYDWLNQWKWHYIKTQRSEYAVRTSWGNNNKQYLYMHRIIMNTPIGFETDHVDHNGLNNQRSNLRLCTHAQNSMNRPIQPNNTSGYRGVTWDKKLSKWSAQIQVNGKHKSIGRFDTPEDAARAYNQYAAQVFGEFAFTNEV